jgi:hypothetical protein
MSYKKVQISIDQARAIINQVSKTILQKANLNSASELLLKPIQYNTPFAVHYNIKRILAIKKCRNIDRGAGINNKSKS